ncbi:MAG: argininosuccinate synthase, partial [Bacteroidota bacterium]
VEFLQAHGIDWSWEKAQYSVNKGLWGTTVGGSETLSSHQALPEAAFPDSISAQSSALLELGFQNGELQSVNGQAFEQAWQAIEAVENVAAPFGIGRDYHTGDTVIGIKGRVGFQASAPKLIIEAHRLLEKHTLGKWQAYWKDQLANWYGMMLHEGQYLDPVMRDIEVFLANAQGQVNGTVCLNLFPHRFETVGLQSDNDLMQAKFGKYGEENLGWTGAEVRGFTKILSNAQKIFYSVNPEKIPL